jgi:hypothetical protein
MSESTGARIEEALLDLDSRGKLQVVSMVTGVPLATLRRIIKKGAAAALDGKTHLILARHLAPHSEDRDTPT